MENWQKELYPVYHRNMWQWLYDNPGMSKTCWPGWGYIDRVRALCFACEWDDACARRNGIKTGEIADMSSFCPCIDTLKGCCYNSAPFCMWEVASTIADPELRIKYRKKYAAIIRDSWKKK